MHRMAHNGALAPAWQPGQSGNPGGRTPTRWLRAFLDAAYDKSEPGKDRRQRIAEHLYEVATSWQIIQLGREYEVASARDSVAAAALLLAYDMGKPSSGPTVRAPANANGSTLDLILATYRQRLLDGELSEGDLATLAALLMANEKAEAEIIARILGEKKGGGRLLKERAEALMAKLEARTVEALPEAESAPAAVPPPSEDKPCP